MNSVIKIVLAYHLELWCTDDAGNRTSNIRRTSMSGLVTRRYFEEKAKRLGLRTNTAPEVIWRQWPKEWDEAIEAVERRDYRLYGAMQKQMRQQDE
jgi:hypothetical protein